MIGSLTLLDKRNLSSDFVDHGFSGITDSRHGQSGESVWEHSTDEETGEGKGLKDVNSGGVNVGKFSINTGNESTEKSKSDEAGRSDGETLTNSGSGVSSSIKRVSSSTDGFIEVAHLGDTTSVVRDGTVSVNGQSNGQASEHTNSRQSNTVHSGPLESEKDGDGQADDGDDGRSVTESESLDNVSGGIEGASTGEFSSWLVSVGGVVLRGNTDDKTGPKTEHDASVSLPWCAIVGLVSEINGDCWGEDTDDSDKHAGHEDGGNNELHLEFGLNGTHIEVSEESCNERCTNTNGGNDHGEVDGIDG